MRVSRRAKFLVRLSLSFRVEARAARRAVLPNQPQQCTGDAFSWPRAARASFLAAMRGARLAFLLCTSALEIRVDDRTVIYNGAVVDSDFELGPRAEEEHECQPDAHGC